mmetsp:Transcript_19463/g.37285  ORF Transcript_19463/g.37285 Transcript_19463/m.37285 type:complete len:380 (-) Transcript_19463:125-1264(-)
MVAQKYDSEMAVELKTQANAAYAAGDHKSALTLYTQALSGKGVEDVGQHVLYSNRSAVYLAMGDAEKALADASAAVQHKPDWSKAFARRGSAQVKLKDFAGAAQSFLRAFELEGKPEYEAQLVDAFMCLFRGVNLTDPTKKLAPGKSWEPGDWAAVIDQGGYQLLLEGAFKKGPKWELVRMAAVLQLAGLALCPLHRKSYFRSGGGAEALASYAMSENIRRVKPPPRMAAVWKHHCGVEYEKSSLLLPAALGLANLTRLPSCVPDLPLGLVMCEHGAGAPGYPNVLRALNRLVDYSATCQRSQSEVATAYRCIVPAVKTQRALDILLAACAYEALERLRKNFEEEDQNSEKDKILHLIRIIFKHPYHPDNQVPGKEIRE